MTPKQDDCRAYHARLSAYLDGDLDQKMVKEIETHLTGCGCCQECLESLRQLKQLLRQVPAKPLPPDLKARLKQCLNKAQKH